MITMKHHPRFPPAKAEPKVINPHDNPFHDVIPAYRHGSGNGSYQYTHRVGRELTLDIARVHGDDLGNYETLEQLTVQLLPPIQGPIEALPTYDVGEQAEAVARDELFNPDSQNNLLSRLQAQDKPNLLVLTHGRIWTPELERAIMAHLMLHGYNPQKNIYGLGGRVIETNAIRLL